MPGPTRRPDRTGPPSSPASTESPSPAQPAHHPSRAKRTVRDTARRSREATCRQAHSPHQRRADAVGHVACGCPAETRGTCGCSPRVLPRMPIPVHSTLGTLTVTDTDVYRRSTVPGRHFDRWIKVRCACGRTKPMRAYAWLAATRQDRRITCGDVAHAAERLARQPRGAAHPSARYAGAVPSSVWAHVRNNAERQRTRRARRGRGFAFTVTHADLAALWESQAGRCAYTGRRSCYHPTSGRDGGWSGASRGVRGGNRVWGGGGGGGLSQEGGGRGGGGRGHRSGGGRGGPNARRGRAGGGAGGGGGRGARGGASSLRGGGGREVGGAGGAGGGRGDGGEGGAGSCAPRGGSGGGG
jgi:hypothetical protein